MKWFIMRYKNKNSSQRILSLFNENDEDSVVYHRSGL